MLLLLLLLACYREEEKWEALYHGVASREQEKGQKGERKDPTQKKPIRRTGEGGTEGMHLNDAQLAFFYVPVH